MDIKHFYIPYIGVPKNIMYCLIFVVKNGKTFDWYTYNGAGLFIKYTDLQYKEAYESMIKHGVFYSKRDKSTAFEVEKQLIKFLNDGK